MLIPRGTYMLGPIVFKGPCKGQVEIQIIGTLKALTNKVSTINVNHWITFQYIDRLVLRGGGKLDGQGASAWDDNTCSKNPNCRALPIVSYYFNKSILNWAKKWSSPWSCSWAFCYEPSFFFFVFTMLPSFRLWSQFDKSSYITSQFYNLFPIKKKKKKSIIYFFPCT